ncbi:hypothetical protein, partial [uncultured Parabacteroides sp.]|uniref:hypothetical protein n=1 Tax=uncultured Parabacteroides sp. TaxID=512312 RepID=UPI0025EE3678
MSPDCRFTLGYIHACIKLKEVVSIHSKLCVKRKKDNLYKQKKESVLKELTPFHIAFAFKTAAIYSPTFT